MKREPGDLDESLVTERLDFPQLLLQSLARTVSLSVGLEREESLGDLEDMLVPWHDEAFRVYLERPTNGTNLNARQRLHLRALMLLMQRAGFLGEKDLV